MLKTAIIALAVAATSLTIGTARADCSDNPPSLLSSYTAMDPNGAPITNPLDGGTIETPAVDTGVAYCASEQNVPRTIPPYLNSFRVRANEDLAPTSGAVIVDGTSYPVAFARSVDATGAATYVSDVVYVNQTTTVAKQIVAEVCFGDACKSTTYATTN